MRDEGFGSYYPRFRAETPVVPVTSSEAKAASTIFQIDQIPNASYDLRLLPTLNGAPIRTDEEWSRVYGILKESRVRVQIGLEPPNGAESKDRVNGLVVGEWTPSYWAGERYFFHSQLTRLRLHGEVKLSLRVESGDSTAMREIGFQVVFVGGGLRI